MAIQRLNKPMTYVPMSDDPQLRHSIERSISIDHNIPIKIADEYPQRGSDIYNKVSANVAQNKREEYIIPSSLKEKVKINDLLVVMCYWGTNKTRMEVTAKALKYLTQMNPMPKVVFVEGSVNNAFHFPYVSKCGFNYVPIDLTPQQYRNLFVKEILWNVGAKKVLAVDPSITKICYMDADVAFVDQRSWEVVDRALDTYEVISPMKAAYYADTNEDAAKYGLLHTTGFYVNIKGKKAGWPGFAVAMQVQFLKKYFNLEVPCSGLGFGDCLFWYLLTARKQMRSFARIPYNLLKLVPYLLPDTIRIGYADTIMFHIFHGSIIDRQYKVKCRLMLRCIREPFSEFVRVNEDGLLCWAPTNEVKLLRCCVENLLILNRQDLKLTSERDADELFDWVTGRRDRPPTKARPNRFAPHGNLQPAAGVSRPIPSKYSEI